MNSKTAVLFVVVYLLALLVRQSYSMQCYTCIGCDDPFDSKAHEGSKGDCSGSCQKIKTAGIVTRNCLPMLKSDKCEEKDDNAICHCTSELCNSALKTQTSAILILSTTSAVLLRKYLF